MAERQYGKGWSSLISSLEKDLRKIAPGLQVRAVVEGKFGELVYSYELDGLTPKEANLVGYRVKRASDLALYTCTVCGEYGKMRYTKEPLKGRVYCDQHKPTDWDTL